MFVDTFEFQSTTDDVIITFVADECVFRTFLALKQCYDLLIGQKMNFAKTYFCELDGNQSFYFELNSIYYMADG